MEDPIGPPPSWRPGAGACAMQHRRASCSGAEASSFKRTSLALERRRASCYSRRHSAVERSFLQLCFGEAAADEADEEEQEAGAGEAQDAGRRIRYLLNADDSDEESPDNPELEGMYAFDVSARVGDGACPCISLDDGSEAVEDGTLGSYEDAFNFDMRKVADAVKRGLPEEEVSELIQAEMFQSLQERLQSGPSVQEVSAAMPPRDAARPYMSEDLSGMMTPPRVAAASGVDGCELEGKLQGVLAEQSSTEERCVDVTPARCRRSSIAHHPQLLEAVGAATSHHRRSLAEAVETELAGKTLTAEMAGRVRQSLVGMQRQRRASLIKAAEVLEEVGVGTTGSRHAPEEVGAQLQLVQKAVEGAWRRHRASVATAVEAASGGAVPSPANVKLMPCQTLTQERVNNVIAAAYEKHRARTGGKGSGPTHFRALMSTRVVTNMPGKSACTVHCGPAPPARRPGSKRC